MKRTLAAIGAATLTVLTLAASPAPAAARELVMATVSLTSDDFQLATAWSNILRRSGLGYTITPVETGTVRGMRSLAQGKVDITVIGAPHYLDAIGRTGSYKEDPPELSARYTDMRVLFAMDSGMAQYVVRADSGIRRFADLKGKTVAIGRPGGNAGHVSTILLRVHGLDAEKGEIRLQYLDYGPALDQLGNGQIDATLVWGGIPQAALDNASRSHRLRFISPDAESLAPFRAAVTNGANYVYRTVPARTLAEAYGGRIEADDPVRFWTFPFMIMVRKDLPEDVAYTITKVFWENVEEVRRASAALRTLDIRNALEGLSAELHPGAARYFKEKKVI
ncbi:MAG TPA: TAXI family TRAP transporter solute-binding subunit [Thermodesulfobacteriota bacterium]